MSNTKVELFIFRPKTRVSTKPTSFLTSLKAEISLETRKCDYTNIIDSEQRDKVLMSLMLNQHQALIRELENGQLDEALNDSSSESAEQEPDAIQSESEPSADSATENKEDNSVWGSP